MSRPRPRVEIRSVHHQFVYRVQSIVYGPLPTLANSYLNYVPAATSNGNGWRVALEMQVVVQMDGFSLE